mmetsp:Transcript_57664/g.172047  ORF Transcript_57664/g.172047 Transcript_57664/m.172047 type:complete len:205 (+) Transcript_57664:2972-3586(+)
MLLMRPCSGAGPKSQRGGNIRWPVSSTFGSGEMAPQRQNLRRQGRGWDQSTVFFQWGIGDLPKSSSYRRFCANHSTTLVVLSMSPVSQPSQEPQDRPTPLAAMVQILQMKSPLRSRWTSGADGEKVSLVAPPTHDPSLPVRIPRPSTPGSAEQRHLILKVAHSVISRCSPISPNGQNRMCPRHTLRAPSRTSQHLALRLERSPG